MTLSLQPKKVFAGTVEEYSNSNSTGFVFWHLTCTCGQRMRVKSGEAAYDCPVCKQELNVSADGKVFRIVYESGDSQGYQVTTEQLREEPPRVGLFGKLSNAVKDATEEAHGKRLLQELRSTQSALLSADSRVITSAVTGFIEKRKDILGQMHNWSRDGRIKSGRALQNEARKCFDFNQAESYSLWLTGAWLESSQRSGAEATTVHSALERLAASMED